MGLQLLAVEHLANQIPRFFILRRFVLILFIFEFPNYMNHLAYLNGIELGRLI